MWLVGFVSLAGLVGLFMVARARERDPSDVGAEPQDDERPTLWRIVPSRRNGGCASALRLEEHRFKAESRPKLPLPGCTMTWACRCRYEAAPERRVQSRRSGVDRRERVRFDPSNPPRRRGPGRRREDWIGWALTYLPLGGARPASVAPPPFETQQNDDAGSSQDENPNEPRVP